MPCHNADGLSGRGLVASLGERKDSSFNKITGNWVMNCTSIVGNWYVSNAAMTLATVLATIPVFFSDGTRLHGVPLPFFMVQVMYRCIEMCKSFNLNKTLYKSSTDAQVAERFEPNTVLRAFHTIQLFSYV